VPIRLALRAIKAGDNPLGQAPVAMGAGAGGAAGAPGAGAGPERAGADWKSTPAGQAREAYLEGVHKWEAGDGQGCLTLLQRAAGLDARQAEPAAFRNMLAVCTMSAGRCDEGKTSLRQVLAAQDVNHNRSDADLDRETRDVANRNCPASTATNATDLIIRTSRDMTGASKADDGAQCRAKFETIIGKLDAAEQETRAAQAQRLPATAVHPWNEGTSSLERGAKCIARASSCDEGLKYYRRYYSIMLHGMKGTDQTATESWQRSIGQGDIKCK
jgi:hypothetical protein